MKRIMKKTLSLALSLVMLLSIMLVGMVPANAETVKGTVNYATAYREWYDSSIGSSNMEQWNASYIGIVPDGNRAAQLELNNIVLVG